jgi:hypothetical protein
MKINTRRKKLKSVSFSIRVIKTYLKCKWKEWNEKEMGKIYKRRHWKRKFPVKKHVLTQ